jgi:hypothetical protein
VVIVRKGEGERGEVVRGEVGVEAKERVGILRVVRVIEVIK